jgi:hypothetical protein
MIVRERRTLPSVPELRSHGLLGGEWFGTACREYLVPIIEIETEATIFAPASLAGTTGKTCPASKERPFGGRNRATRELLLGLFLICTVPQGYNEGTESRCEARCAAGDSRTFVAENAQELDCE